MIFPLLLPLALFAPADSAEQTLQKAQTFLLKSQNLDGSWGSPRNALPIDLFGPNDGNHRLCRHATTALCALALLETGKKPEEKAALDRALNFLIQDGPQKRPSNWEVYNTWSYIYSIQFFARVYGDSAYRESPIREKIKIAGEKEIQELARYQTPAGGWGYYEDDNMKRPSWATSFTTAAGILALLEAKAQGFSMPEKMLPRAVKAVRRCLLPSGAYTYSVEATPTPGGLEWIDQIKGSLGRIQVGNLALLLAGEKISKKEILRGLENLFDHHKFLEIARKRPIPHEAYYFNSGYFYFFGHHYAAMLIEQLPVEDQKRYWPKLQEGIISCQEKDGSVWDWFLNDYSKPYATAFAAMALGRSLKKNSSN